MAGLGYTQAQIAQMLGCVQSSVSDLANKPRIDPSYTFGMKVIDLHGRLMRGAKASKRRSSVKRGKPRRALEAA